MVDVGVEPCEIRIPPAFRMTSHQANREWVALVPGESRMS